MASLAVICTQAGGPDTEQGPQMVLGAPGGPCGLRRICVRWLCDEISAQSPSKFPW